MAETTRSAVMTPDEAYEKIQLLTPCEMSKWEDSLDGIGPDAHIAADEFCVKLLRELGYADVADYVEAISDDFWFE